MKSIIGIYKIVNIKNNKIYLGSSKNIINRWKIHRQQLNNNKHINIHLQRSWNIYGQENFKFEIIETCDKYLLFEREQYYLDTLENLYNIGKNSSGGDNISNHPDKDIIILKMKESLKKHYSNLSNEKIKEKSERTKGDKNPNYNKRWKDKDKKIASDRKKEYYKNHKQYNEGKKYEEVYDVETAKRMRENLSKLASNKTGVKNPFYNKKHTDETKLKIAKKRKGVYNGQQNIPFSINGEIYNSLGDASKKLNMPICTIRWRIKSKNDKYENYKYI